MKNAYRSAVAAVLVLAVALGGAALARGQELRLTPTQTEAEEKSESVAVENIFPTPYVPTVLTNAVQLETVWRDFEWHYPAGAFPWQPGWFEPAAVWWTDFEHLDGPLAKVQDAQGEKQLGVTLWPVWVTLFTESGKLELVHPWTEDQLLLLPAVDKETIQQAQQELWTDFGTQCGLTLAQAQTIADGNRGESPRVVLNLWLADVREQTVFEKNLAVAAARWMEEEAAAAKLAAATPASAVKNGGQQMLMGEGGGDPCDSTNAPPRLGFTLVVTPSNVLAHVEFPSCSSHLYQLQTSTNMLDWIAVTTIVGENAITVWEQPADVERRFFRLFRMAMDGDQDDDGLSNNAEFTTYGTDPGNPDTDGDGMPDGWEVQYGFNPLNPSDGGGDSDGDGVCNFVEYVQGRDPTKGAAGDEMGVISLEVFTVME